MAISRISADKDAVISEIEIGAPPERVFQALIKSRADAAMGYERRIPDDILGNGHAAGGEVALYLERAKRQDPCRPHLLRSSRRGARNRSAACVGLFLVCQLA